MPTWLIHDITKISLLSFVLIVRQWLIGGRRIRIVHLNQQIFNIMEKTKVSIPKPRVTSPVVYADARPEDNQQKTEATHHTQHNIERVWGPEVRAGRRGHS